MQISTNSRRPFRGAGFFCTSLSVDCRVEIQNIQYVLRHIRRHPNKKTDILPFQEDGDDNHESELPVDDAKCNAPRMLGVGFLTAGTDLSLSFMGAVDRPANRPAGSGVLSAW